MRDPVRPARAARTACVPLVPRQRRPPGALHQHPGALPCPTHRGPGARRPHSPHPGDQTPHRRSVWGEAGSAAGGCVRPDHSALGTPNSVGIHPGGGVCGVAHPPSVPGAGQARGQERRPSARHRDGGLGEHRRLRHPQPHRALQRRGEDAAPLQQGASSVVCRASRLHQPARRRGLPRLRSHSGLLPAGDGAR